jgi:fused signal recognition particle receptor
MAENSWSLGRALRGMFVKPTIDDNTWDDLETALLTADFGPDITERIVDELREKVERFRTTDPRDLQRMLKETLEEHFAKFDTTLRLTERPAVVLVVGVNGVGKTTTIGKFAKFLQRYGRSVVVGAADTRAAAVDQLATWAERGGARSCDRSKRDRTRHPSPSRRSTTPSRTGRDRPGRHGRTPAHQGRPHGRAHQDPSRHREAGADQRGAARARCDDGQNGVMQAEAFLEHAGVTGLVITKLDGSAKGGFVLAVQERTGIPVKLLGQGEGIGDLTGFTPHVFASALVD